MWPFQSDPDAAFSNAVRKEFAPLAVSCEATLKQIEPSIFGFVTEYAVLTIGACPGHFRGICVKLRQRRGHEQLSVRDGEDIGLANVEAFATGKVSGTHTKRQRWAADEIAEEVVGLANITRAVALTYLTSPTANWLGLRAFVDAKIEQSLREQPWLKKYS
jgi:hypothetical protein